MITAPGTESFVVLSLQKNRYARRTPRPGPGFGSSIYMIDFPVSAACAVAIGVKIPWLIALFRNKTLAGSIKIATRGSRLF